MSAFNWTAARMNRLRSAVRAYNAAITRQTKELENAGYSYYADFLPSKITVKEIQSRVHNTSDYRRIVGYKNDRRHNRPSELDRILKSVNPEALQIVEKDGVITTNYSAHEYTLNQRAIRRQRLQTRKDMAAKTSVMDESRDLDTMSSVEYATATTNNDLIGDFEGEIDESIEEGIDKNTLNRWREEDAKNKRSQVTPDAMVEVYLSVWQNPINAHQNMPGYQALIDAVEWMLAHNVSALSKMFASGHDEVDINYIVDSGRNVNPYINIPYETRHNRAVKFITNWARGAGYEG